MRCAYCGVEVINYPDNGICVHCGGKLPERPSGTRCSNCGTYSSGNFCSACGRNLTGAASSVAPVQPVYAPVQPVYIPVQQMPYSAPVHTCPKCRSTQVIAAKRGFSWGLGILGFFLIPVFGLLLGFCGSKKPRLKCTACNHKWKHA